MRIDDIDWSSVEHAYGPAEDVPRTLAALRSDDPGERAGAFYHLYGTLWHQYSVYPATATAIPFLVESVLDPGYPDRLDLLRYLGRICHGCGAALPAVRAALAREAPRLRPLLSTADADVRAGALWMLSVPQLHSLGADVARLTTDPVPAVRAMAWLCLGACGPRRLPDTCEDDEPAVRLAWTLACADGGSWCDAELAGAPGPLVGAEPSAAANLGRLIAALLRDGTSLPGLQGLIAPYRSDSPLVRCGELLRADTPELLDALCEMLATERVYHAAAALSDMLLGVAFSRAPDEPRERRTVELSGLDARQRAVLAAIARNDALWTALNIELDLDRHGVEEGRDELFAGLGLSVPRHHAPPAPSTSDTFDEQEPCVPYSELTEELKVSLDMFAKVLEHHGWSEIRASYQSACQLGEAGISMTPLALARRLGATSRAEVGYHVESAGPDGGLFAYVQVTVVHADIGRRLRIGLDADSDQQPLFERVATLDLSREPDEALEPLVPPS